ncbi:hypothetical protein [Pelagibacterium sp.]|uniref:hypothetical protein n=1 Tax=Pelagibacterium sp. TaxID=1967288 RepID=UPI003A8CBF51
MRFLAMIRAAFAALATVMVTFVREGGRLVRRVVSIGSPPAPQMPFEIAEAALRDADREETKAGNEWEAIRQLAASLAAGSVRPEQVEAVSPEVVEWLRAMPRLMLCRVACASDTAIELHLHGISSMKGVLAYDREAIADYGRADPAPRRRYLRDVVNELGQMQTA